MRSAFFQPCMLLGSLFPYSLDSERALGQRLWFLRGVLAGMPVLTVFSPQVAVCNLASIALNMYVTSEHTYDFKKLAEVTKVIVRNLNKIIDINYYPVPEVSAVRSCCGAGGMPRVWRQRACCSVANPVWSWAEGTSKGFCKPLLANSWEFH